MQEPTLPPSNDPVTPPTFTPPDPAPTTPSITPPSWTPPPVSPSMTSPTLETPVTSAAPSSSPSPISSPAPAPTSPHIMPHTVTPMSHTSSTESSVSMGSSGLHSPDTSFSSSTTHDATPPSITSPEPLKTEPPMGNPVSPAAASGFHHFGWIMAVLIGIVAILIGIVAYYMGMQDGKALQLVPSPTPAYEVVVSPLPSEEPIICTMDAMICPDGTSVGRTGPDCEFICPVSTATPSPVLDTTIPVPGATQSGLTNL